jgi:hypothetical protein
MLPGGAKSFCHEVVTRLGRAFGYGPNASACEMKSAVRKLLNQGSFLATYPISATAVIKM